MRWILLVGIILIPGMVRAGENPQALESLTTAYWVRSYEIPDYYKTVAAAIPDKDPQSAFRRWQERLKSLGARRITLKSVISGWRGRNAEFPARGQSVWEIPTSSVAALVGLLNSEPKLEFMNVRDRPYLPHSEFLSKREALLGEIAGNPPLLDSDPIRSLVEKELQTLNILLHKDDRARDTTALLISFGLPGGIPPLVDFPDHRLQNVGGAWARAEIEFRNAEVNLSTRTSPYTPQYWKRSALMGTPLRVFNVILQVKDSKTAREKVDKLQKKFKIDLKGFNTSGAYVTTVGNLTLGSGVPIAIESSRAMTLKKKLISIGDIATWTPASGGQEDYAAAAEKFTLLKTEARSLATTLKMAPATRTLVNSEIERLRPYADKNAAAQGKEVIVVFIKSP
ncbi:MAG TPA: hypothetical protein VN915_01760 [Elusimicrobiota bacterium]|nr:hypothetical protein [Elusimicrobiota bacterium]